jgi:large subunit ribosomal protein L29
MKTKEIRELSTEEIAERIAVAKNSLDNLKINHSISPLDNPMQIKETRRDIARLNTELTKRKNEENK